MNEERNKLIEEIDDLISKTKYFHGDCYYTRAIADFIIADRKRICEPLRQNFVRDSIKECAYAMEHAIKETLNRAGLGYGK